jgi:hypothetical protein
MDYYSYSPYYRPRHIFKYPKFLMFTLTFVAVYVLFQGSKFKGLQGLVIPLGYLGVFIAGVLYSYGFTGAAATGMLLILGTSTNIYLAALIGGLGSLLTDFILFFFIRSSFKDEIEQLSHEKWVIYLNYSMPRWLRKIIVPVIGSAIIASPLPDEIGVTMLATARYISPKVFGILSFMLNTIGILIVLLIGKSI